MSIEKQIIELYQEGIRPSLIVKKIDCVCNVEKVKLIIDDYRKKEYLSREYKGVSNGEVHLLYLEDKSLFEIMQVYPELTYGEVNNMICGYYQMLGIKKPIKIPFPEKMLRQELKTKSLEQVSEEYDIPVRIIKDRVGIKLTKEEYFEKKMQTLETDVNTMKPKAFENKYKKYGLKHEDVKRLVKEYKDKNRK